MLDVSWDGVKTLVSIALTVGPVVIKFRGQLARVIYILSESIGLIALVFGTLLYTHSLPRWQQLQTSLVEISKESPILAAQQHETLFTLYTGSIALMVLGGLLAFSGLLGRIRAGMKRR